MGQTPSVIKFDPSAVYYICSSEGIRTRGRKSGGIYYIGNWWGLRTHVANEIAYGHTVNDSLGLIGTSNVEYNGSE